MDEIIDQAPQESAPVPAVPPITNINTTSPPPPQPQQNGVWAEWGQVANAFKTAYPEADQDQLRQEWERGRRLSMERQRFSGAEEVDGAWLTRRAVPYGSAAANTAREIAYGQARQRLEAGNPSDNDYELIAAHERLQSIDARDRETFGGQMADAIARLPAVVGEFAVGGQLLKGAASLFPRALGFLAPEAAAAAPNVAARVGIRAAQGAATTPFTPSMFLEQAARGNIEAGRDPMDWRGLPAPMTLAAIQNTIFAGIGDVGGNIENAVLRAGARTLTGMGAKQAADTLTSAVGLQVGYGTLGELIRDPEKGLQQAAVDAVTFAIFAGMHDLNRPVRRPRGPEQLPFSERPAEGLPGPEPTKPGEGGAQAEAPEAGGPRETILNNFRDALQWYYDRRARYRDANVVGRIFEGIRRDYDAFLADNPNPTRAEAAHYFRGNDQMPEPLRRFVQSLALTFPETRNTEAPPTPSGAQRRAQQPVPDAEVVNRPQIETTPEMRPQEPQAMRPLERPAVAAEAQVPAEQRPNAAAEQPEAPVAIPETVRPATEQVSIPGSEQPNAQPVRDRLAGMRRRQQEIDAAPRPSEPVIRAEPAPPRPESPAEPAAPKLDAREQHILDQRALGRSLESIGADPQVRGEGNPMSREGVRKIEKAARAKLGEATSMAEVHSQEKAARTLDLIAEGRSVDAGDLHADPEKAVRYIDAYSKAESRYIAAVDRLIVQHAREVAKGKLSPERTAFYESEYRRLDEQRTREQQGKVGKAPGVPAELPGERPAEGPAAERRVETPAVAGQREAVPGGAGEASPSQDGGRNQLTPEQRSAQRREQLRKNIEGQRSLLDTLKQYGGLSAESVHSHGFDPKMLKEEIPSVFEAYDRDARRQAASLRAKYASLAVMPPNVRKEYNQLMRKRVPGRMEMTQAAERLRDEGHLHVPVGREGELHEVLYDALTNRVKTLADNADAIYEREMAEYYRLQREAEATGYDPKRAKEIADAGRESGGNRQRAKASEETVREYAEPEDFQGPEPPAGTDVGTFDPSEFDTPSKPAALSREDQASADFFAPREEQGKLDLRTSEAPQTLAQAQAEIDARTKPTTIEKAWADKNRPKEEPSPLLRDKINQLIRDEGGYLDVDQVVNGIERVSDYLGELGGKMGPRTTRLSNRAGEALARYNVARTFAREAIPYYIDKVMGEDSTPQMRRLAGAALTESRLRYMREVFRQQGDTEAANKVTSIIGKDNSPFKNESDFVATLQSPQVQQIIQRYREFFVPEMDNYFRKAEGLRAEDPIESSTQIPGFPINLKPVRPGDALGESTVFTGGGRGNLKNVRLRKLGFARKATGSSEGYDVDLGAIMENTLQNSVELGTKHEMIRTLVEEGLAKWDRPGQRAVLGEETPTREIPFVTPPRGTQVAGAGQPHLYVDARIYDEIRRALQVDEKAYIPVVTDAASLITKATLASTVEAAYHSKNLATFLFKPTGFQTSMLHRMMVNGYKVLTKDPEIKRRIVELARIGAMKAEGMESGPMAKYNPLQIMGRLLETMQKTMRLTAEDAFDGMAKAGLVENTETNKRDFINQLGQYNRQSQNKIVAWLRDTGLGPFATAGTNYYMQGLKALTMSPGVRTTSWRAEIQLRAEMLAKAMLLVGAAAAANYMLWRRVDGDENTPFGAIKVGEEGGKIQHINPFNFTGIPRGARQIGLLSLYEGIRHREEPAKIVDKGVESAIHSVMHPATGPVVQFGWTAATGRSTMGQHVAERAHPDESQAWRNLQAALLNANPVVGTVTGADRPRNEDTAGDKINRLLGPYGIQSRKMR